VPRASAVLIAVLSALTFLPAFAIGGVHPATQLVVLAVALSALLLLLVRYWRSGLRIFTAPASLMAVMIIGCAMTALQLIPLPRSVVGLVSPVAAHVRMLVDGGGSRFWPLTLSVWATRLALVKHLTCFICFLVAAAVVNRGAQATALVKSFFVGGLLLAGLGLAERTYQVEKILGFYDTGSWHGFVATFVNPNHAAGFFLLVIGAGLAIMSMPGVRHQSGVALLLAFPIACVAISGSRGGLLGLGVLAATRLLSARQLEQTKPIVPLVAGGAVLALLFSIAFVPTQLSHRLEGTLHEPIERNQKVQVWKDTLAVVHDFAVTGAGRGAFEEVFSRYKTFRSPLSATHAEDLPLQAAAEWGIPVALVCIVLTTVGMVSLWRRSRFDSFVAGLYAGLAGLLAQNLFDFNLEFDGTAVPAAILLGLACARTKRWHHGEIGLSPRFPLLAVAMVAVIAGGLALHAGRHTRAGELATLTDLPPVDDEGGVVARRDIIERVFASHPADYFLQYRGALELLRDHNAHGLAHLGAAMDLNPLHADSHYAAARVLGSAGRPQQAALEFRKAFELGFEPTRGALVEVLSRCGPQETVAVAPKDARTRLMLAGLFAHSGAQEAARELYWSMIEAPESEPGVHSSALQELMALVKPDDVTVAERLAKTARLSHDVRVVIDIWKRAGQPERADDFLLAATARVPSDADLATRAADLFMERDEPREAEQALSRAVEHTDGPQARMDLLMRLALVQESLGKLSAARESRHRAFELRLLHGLRGM
jgi:Tfp pilus assembly protein PilF